MKVGILGGGQLGQMLIQAAYPLGVETDGYESFAGSPSAQVGTVTVGTVDETEKLHEWASQCDVITYEWENFPAPLVADLSEIRPVLPDTVALATTQDRWQEKRLFTELKIPVAPFRLIETDEDVYTALSELNLPVIFKTRTGGYDGKGQLTIGDGEDLTEVMALLKQGSLIVEERLKLTTEISVIGVRDQAGHTITYPVAENEHRQGILHRSSVPAAVSDELLKDAHTYMDMVLNRLNYVGVLALELFVVNTQLVANEMAPRVHNSGHWTIEGAETSQFENHIRAVAGLPLGSTDLVGPTAMVNLVGAIPDAASVLKTPGAHLHLYGKSARPGRKVGHITVVAKDATQLKTRVDAVEAVVNNVLS